MLKIFMNVLENIFFDMWESKNISDKSLLILFCPFLVYKWTIINIKKYFHILYKNKFYSVVSKPKTN